MQLTAGAMKQVSYSYDEESEWFISIRYSVEAELSPYRHSCLVTGYWKANGFSRSVALL